MTSQLELFSDPAALNKTVANEIALQLRGYQQDCREAIHRLHKEEGENRLIAQLATGGGKTIIFSAVTLDEMHGQFDKQALILAHRDELLSQAIAKLRMVWPHADIGRVQANFNQTGHQVTVSSVQTLCREKRFSEAFPDPRRVGLVITDECHHVAAESYGRIYGWLNLDKPRQPGAPLHLGVTATPIRGDKESLGNAYDRFAYKWDIRRGIKSGYLCDLKGYVVAFSNEKIADVGMKNGDYDAEQLGDAINSVARNEAIVQAWQEQAHRESPHQDEYRQTVAFCLSIEHAESVADTFNRFGIKSDVIHSEMPKEKRQRILADFEAQKLKVLVNCMVLTEGWDVPSVECVIMARPTRNSSLYIQCVGRGTRLFPQGGKRNCLILDVADVSSKTRLTFKPQTLDKVLELSPEGQEKKQIASVQEFLFEMEEGELGGKPKSYTFSDVKGGKAFNPFDPFDNNPALNLRWTMGGSGLTLSLPQKNELSRHFLILRQRKDLLWDIVHLRQHKEQNDGGFVRWVNRESDEKFVNEYGLPDQQAAAVFAEKYAAQVCPEVNQYKSRSSFDRMNERPATGRQLEILQSKGIQIEIDGRRLTMAEASALLDSVFAKKVKAKSQRSAEQLELY